MYVVDYHDNIIGCIEFPICFHVIIYVFSRNFAQMAIFFLTFLFYIGV